MGCTASKIKIKRRDQNISLPISKKELEEIIKKKVDERVKAIEEKMKSNLIDKSNSTRDLESINELNNEKNKKSRSTKNKTSIMEYREKPKNKMNQINVEKRKENYNKDNNFKEYLRNDAISEEEEEFDSVNTSKVSPCFRVCDKSSHSKSEISFSKKDCFDSQLPSENEFKTPLHESNFEKKSKVGSQNKSSKFDLSQNREKKKFARRVHRPKSFYPRSERNQR